MATTTFKNPANGYTEEVNGFTAFLGGLILGPIYFAIKGLWAAAIILFIFTAASFAILPLTLIAIPMHIGMALGAASMIKSKYLRQGWVELTNKNTSESPMNVVQRRYKELQDMKEKGQLNEKEFDLAVQRLESETGVSFSPKPQIIGAANNETNPTTKSLSAQILELNQLKEQGVLTESEFTAAKQKLLSPEEPQKKTA